MATIYNKTALNKIKKADLIALFLEQQAEKNQLVLDAEEHEKVKSHMIYMGHDKMKADLKKLKEENKKLKDTIVSLKSSVDDLREARDMRDQQIKELKEQIDEQYSFSYFKQIKELTAENKNLRDQVKTSKECMDMMEKENEKLKVELDDFKENAMDEYGD